MMPIATDVALALGSSSAASIIAKVTVVLAMTLVGVRLARTTRAAVRHVLLAATFAVLLALPVASMVIPSVSLVAVPTMAGRITESPASPHLTDSTRRVAEPVSAVSSERAMITSFRLSPSAFLLTGWAIGVLDISLAGACRPASDSYAPAGGAVVALRTVGRATTGCRRRHPPSRRGSSARCGVRPCEWWRRPTNDRATNGRADLERGRFQSSDHPRTGTRATR